MLRTGPALVVITSLLAPHAHAESPPTQCFVPWWSPSTLALTATGLAPDSAVLLPVVWAQISSLTVLPPTADQLAALSVVVRDAADQPVAGAVTLGALTDDGTPGFTLDRVPVWRAAASLTPGTYTLQVAAPAPVGGDYTNCHYAAVTRDLTFEVAAEPVADPTLTLDAALEAYVVALDYGTDCADRGDVQACPGELDACCWSTGLGLLFDGTAIADDLLAGGDDYYALVLRHDTLRPPYEAESQTVYPLLAGVPVPFDERYRPAPYERENYPFERCVTADLWDLGASRVAATATRCRPAHALLATPPAFTCNYAACEAALEPPPVEPGPEPVLEPLPDVGADAGDVTADGADTAADVAELGLGPCKCDDDGCAGGRADLTTTLVLAGALLAARAGRRRRPGSPTRPAY